MTLRRLTAGVAALALVAAPAFAASAPTPQAAVSGSARAGVALQDSDDLATDSTTTWVFAGLGLVVVVVAIILLLDDDDNEPAPPPASP